MELWKRIKGFENYYMISNKGRVMSLVKRSGNHGKIIEAQREKILTPCDNGNGYLYVTLRSGGGKRKNCYVHRLVAEMFIDNPHSYKCVNHLDYDIKNNRAENLQWCTQKENVRYSSERMRHPKSIYKASNTGEKYIHEQSYKSGGKYYRLCIRPFGIDRKFKTLEDAIKLRNEVVR